MNINERIKIIEHYCLRDDLSTYDPYDIWKNKFSILLKKFYFKNHIIGTIPVAILTLIDYFFKPIIEFFIEKKEYPIVRAQAAIALLNLYKKHSNEKYLHYAKKHIDWLLKNNSTGYSGLCWGTGFQIVISATSVYNKNTPYTTVTPYVLEALDLYFQITNDSQIALEIKKIYDFYELDIVVLKDDSDIFITSYSASTDRIVTNAVSYTMYAYSIFYNYIDNKQYIEDKIIRMYNFIASVQQLDGSWLYAPYEKNSFIDCFHTCFILKNLIKTNKSITLPNCKSIINIGYIMAKRGFQSKSHTLFKRFILKNKPSLVKFDLYDNAEMLLVMTLLGDLELQKELESNIFKKFYCGNNIYSEIGYLGFRKNKNYLRWAVMPLILTLSNL